MKRPAVTITEEEATRLVEIMVRKGRGTIEECWMHVAEHFDIARQEAA